MEKRARPPLIPAPIVKPLAEAIAILLSFFSGTESRLSKEQYPEEDGEREDFPQCLQFASRDLPSSLRKPSFALGKHEQQPSASEDPSPDGDITKVDRKHQENVKLYVGNRNNLVGSF